MDNDPSGSGHDETAATTADHPDPTDPDGVAALVDGMEERIANQASSAAGDASAGQEGPGVIEQDIDLDDLTGAGGSPPAAEPPA